MSVHLKRDTCKVLKKTHRWEKLASGGLAKAVQSGEEKYRYGGTDERVNEKVKAEIGRRLVEEGTFREGEDALVEMKKGERQDEACNRMIRIDVRAYC